MVLYALTDLFDGDMITCPVCKGVGKAIYSDFNIRLGIWDDVKLICKTCKGKRLVKIKLVPLEDN